MAELITVELRLIEQTFRLSTTTDEKADLERAGQLLNEKFTQEDAPSKYQHLSPSPGGP